jgi:hypothetical protein
MLLTTPSICAARPVVLVKVTLFAAGSYTVCPGVPIPRVPVKVRFVPLLAHATLPAGGVVSNLMSMLTPWIRMSLVVTAVALHGKFLPVAVRVQPVDPPTVPWQLVNEELVIVSTAALSLMVWKVTLRQNDPEFSAGRVNPRLLALISPEPTQLAAVAIDGITNAHTANTTPKSNTRFLKTFFNI